MLLAVAAVIVGLVILIWSADKFVDGASAVATYAGMPPLLVGMLVIGFGTSAPEMVVSAFAAAQGNPALALGNAYGSNISNLALVLGIMALVVPVAVHSSVVRKELPLLAAITLVAGFQMLDGTISRADATVLLLLFAALMGWSIYVGVSGRRDPLALAPDEVAADTPELSRRQAAMALTFGLVLLIISSRLLVWGAVTLAVQLGVNELVIGLTVVAIGTSLPELASGIAALRQGKPDLAVGNLVGSNLFNTLVVVGIAGLIHPVAVPADVLQRDWPVMMAITLLMFPLCVNLKGGMSVINRWEGALLLLIFVLYSGYLIWTIFAAAGLA